MQKTLLDVLKQTLKQKGISEHVHGTSKFEWLDSIKPTRRDTVITFHATSPQEVTAGSYRLRLTSSSDGCSWGQLLNSQSEPIIIERNKIRYYVDIILHPPIPWRFEKVVSDFYAIFRREDGEDEAGAINIYAFTGKLAEARVEKTKEKVSETAEMQS